MGSRELRRDIAEGIEREHEALELEALGCRLGQGYFFGRPNDAAAAGLRLAGGRLTISPRPGGGTRVLADLPLRLA